MTQPTCLITGTTHGIGRVTARRIAEAGFTLVMACRDPHRAQSVRNDLAKTTGNEDIHVLECDLSSLASVRRCAQDFHDHFDSLTLLVNNAGTMTTQYQTSADGFELTFACNHLGPFLLTRLVLDKLLTSQPARIVNVASAVHVRGSIDLNRFRRGQQPGRYRGMRAYADSKLASVMFTLSLRDVLAGSAVTANCLHPGVVATNIVADTNPFLRIGMKIAGTFMFDHERGAETTVHLSLSEDLDAISGKYFNEHQIIRPPSEAAMGEESRQALWQHCEQICDLEPLTETGR